jgi:signal transduction histidine kinase
VGKYDVLAMNDPAPAEIFHRRSTDRPVEGRILILAPTGDDATLVSEILVDRGLNAVTVADMAALAQEIQAGAAVVLLASEALDEPGAGSTVQSALAGQEPWSEMPVVLFGGDVEDAVSRATALIGTRAQLVVLERPLGMATFVTAIDAALRSRRRQYEVKRLLDALADSTAAIRQAHEAATRAKDEFLATLGHELRSPMTAIRGWIRLLQEGELGPEETATALSMIDSSTLVQSRIIEDLMDVSRIIAGKVMIEPSRIELGPVVAKMVATFTPTAGVEGIDLTADLTTEPLFAWADETRLQQVGWNLLSNAIKFTPRGGAVTVSLARDGSRAVMRVRDTGLGIAPDLLPHVFERYRQDEGNGRKAQQGLGLGLAIVRHLVESHGGTIQVFSEGLGKGAELVVSLPLVD